MSDKVEMSQLPPQIPENDDLPVPLTNGGLPVSLASFLHPSTKEIVTNTTENSTNPLIPSSASENGPTNDGQVKSETINPNSLTTPSFPSHHKYGSLEWPSEMDVSTPLGLVPQSSAQLTASPTTINPLAPLAPLPAPSVPFPNPPARSATISSMLSVPDDPDDKEISAAMLEIRRLNSETEQKPDYSTLTCAVCSRLTDREYAVPIRALKPRFFALLRRRYPTKVFHGSSQICTSDLYALLLDQVGNLLEEDQNERIRLQDAAMKTLAEYEQQEEGWQKQFDGGRTFGAKAADAVARFGGSWGFVIALISFIAGWAILNLAIPHPWDEYPFILLNLFLSMLAGLQAPIIMMSQNRQAERDRIQNDFVSTITLRSEHQVRHINAKLDHLLNHQWRRLLEIQDIQLFLMEAARDPSKPKVDPQAVKSFMASGVYAKTLQRRGTMDQHTYASECQPDAHAQLLLRAYFNQLRADDLLLFSHWHHDGDNFSGHIEKVRIEYKKQGTVPVVNGKIRTIVYDLVLSDPTASLDDIFSGDQTLTLRNDFDVAHMELEGIIRKVDVLFADGSSTTMLNGQVPARYKPAFAMQRIDKVTDIWKTHIEKLTITYQPPNQAILLRLNAGQRLTDIAVQFFSHETTGNQPMMTKGRASPVNGQTLNLYMLQNPEDSLSYLKNVMGQPLGQEWKVFASVQNRGDDEIVDVETELVGPNTFIFFPKPGIRVNINASIEW